MSYKILRLIITVALLAIFLSFAAYNQSEVTLTAPWPFNGLVYYSTVAWVTLGGFIVGVLFSVTFLGSTYLSNWNSLRKKQKENTKLEFELAQMKKSPIDSNDSSAQMIID